MWPNLEVMPIYYWNGLHEKRDPSFLLSSGRTPWWGGLILFRHWKKLTQEYYDRFGMPHSQRMMFERLRRIMELKIQKYTQEDRSLQLLIDIEQQEYDAMQKQYSEGGADMYGIKTALEKYLGFALNTKTVSVVEFHTYIKDLNNGRERSSKE